MAAAAAAAIGRTSVFIMSDKGTAEGLWATIKQAMCYNMSSQLVNVPFNIMCSYKHVKCLIV